MSKLHSMLQIPAMLTPTPLSHADQKDSENQIQNLKVTNGPNEVIDDSTNVKLLEEMMVENDDKEWRERDEDATDIL